jgi:hypothetical protein
MKVALPVLLDRLHTDPSDTVGPIRAKKKIDDHCVGSDRVAFLIE